MNQCASKSKMDASSPEVQCQLPDEPKHRMHRAKLDGWDYEWQDGDDGSGNGV